MKILKAIIITAAIFGGLHLVEDTPAPVQWEPGNSAERVSAFIRGDAASLDESDLNSPSVSPELRRAALLLID
jgi:hypothetical protein